MGVTTLPASTCRLELSLVPCQAFTQGKLELREGAATEAAAQLQVRLWVLSMSVLLARLLGQCGRRLALV